jgi:hypothetical protein
LAKEYFVEIGTRKRPVRYTRAERVEIEQRFDCDIRTFVYSKAFPVEDGKPTLGGRLECQEALIYYGVRHIKGKITEASISEELQAHVAAGGTIYKPLSEAIVALLASGILGWNPPLPTDEDAEGKEQAGGEGAQTTIAPTG